MAVSRAGIIFLNNRNLLGRRFFFFMTNFTQQHKPHLWLWLVLIIIVGISGYLTFSSPESATLDQTVSDLLPINTESEEEPQTDLIDDFVATLTVGDTTYNTKVVEGTTVHEVMATLTTMSIQAFSFSGQDYGGDMGFFVNEINGVKNDNVNGKYWIYYINDKEAQVGISHQTLKSGDIIEWKYEESHF